MMLLVLLSVLMCYCVTAQIHNGEIYFKIHKIEPYYTQPYHLQSYHHQPYHQQTYHQQPYLHQPYYHQPYEHQQSYHYGYPINHDYGGGYNSNNNFNNFNNNKHKNKPVIGASIQFSPSKFSLKKLAHKGYKWFRRLRRFKKKKFKFIKRYACKSPFHFNLLRKYDVHGRLQNGHGIPYGYGKEYFPQGDNREGNKTENNNKIINPRHINVNRTGSEPIFTKHIPQFQPIEVSYQSNPDVYTQGNELHSQINTDNNGAISDNLQKPNSRRYISG